MKWNFMNAFKYFGPNPCQLLIHSSQMNLFCCYLKREQNLNRSCYNELTTSAQSTMEWIRLEKTHFIRELSPKSKDELVAMALVHDWEGLDSCLVMWKSLPLWVCSLSKINQFLPFCTTKNLQWRRDVPLFETIPGLWRAEVVHLFCVKDNPSILPVPKASQPKWG